MGSSGAAGWPADKFRVLQLLAFEDLNVNLDILKAYAASGVSPNHPRLIALCGCATLVQMLAD